MIVGRKITLVTVIASFVGLDNNDCLTIMSLSKM